MGFDVSLHAPIAVTAWLLFRVGIPIKQQCTKPQEHVATKTRMLRQSYTFPKKKTRTSLNPKFSFVCLCKSIQKHGVPKVQLLRSVHRCTPNLALENPSELLIEQLAGHAASDRSWPASVNLVGIQTHSVSRTCALFALASATMHACARAECTQCSILILARSCQAFP